MLFREKLAELRRAKGLSRQQLAKRSGVSHKTIGHYERSEQGLPQMRLMARLLEALEVPFETFACCDDVKSIGKMAA